jgi:hypothetical protein
MITEVVILTMSFEVVVMRMIMAVWLTMNMEVVFVRAGSIENDHGSGGAENDIGGGRY